MSYSKSLYYPVKQAAKALAIVGSVHLSKP
jgi:hypothetical protein